PMDPGHGDAAAQKDDLAIGLGRSGVTAESGSRALMAGIRHRRQSLHGAAGLDRVAQHPEDPRSDGPARSVAAGVVCAVLRAESALCAEGLEAGRVTAGV